MLKKMSNLSHFIFDLNEGHFGYCSGKAENFVKQLQLECIIWIHTARLFILVVLCVVMS